MIFDMYVPVFARAKLGSTPVITNELMITITIIKSTNRTRWPSNIQRFFFLFVRNSLQGQGFIHHHHFRLSIQNNAEWGRWDLKDT